MAEEDRAAGRAAGAGAIGAHAPGPEGTAGEGWDDWDEGWASAPRWWGWAALLLSVAGLGISIYLTVDHFTGSLPVCAATGPIDCAKVTTSPQSYLFGIPVALLGLIFFVVMVAVNLPPFWQPGGLWRTRLAWARLALVVGGLGFVVWLVYAEVAVIKAICLWCTGVHLLTLLLFVLVVATFSPLVGGSGPVEG